MSKTYSTMKTEVGNNVMDTSTTTSALIGSWLNNRYFDILRRTNTVQAIDPDYSFSLAVSATLVSLPADFGKELYVYDDTNDLELDRADLDKLITDFPDELNSSGTVERYAIIDSVTSTGLRCKYFRPHRIPTSVITVQMPYQISPLALTSDGGYTVAPIEDGMILGATADTWRYKRQFAKADTMEAMYEKWLASYVWDKENQPNKVQMTSPTPYDRDYV